MVISINWEFIRQVGYFNYLLRSFIRQFYKRILKKDLKMKLPTGNIYSVAPSDSSAAEVFITRASVDWGSEAVLYKYLSNTNGIFIDIGAHTGYYSLYMAPAVKQVIAFEPDEMSFNMLQANLSGAKATIFNCAVSNKTGIFRLRVAAGGYSFISEDDTHITTKNQETINVVRVDDYYMNRFDDPVAGIKIDIDGTDLDALEGCVRLIERDRPIILTELSSREDDRLLQMCGHLDYLVFAFVKNMRSNIFKAIHQENIHIERFKMLFLVPGEKQANLLNVVQLQ